jgi:hypothetical protein
MWAGGLMEMMTCVLVGLMAAYTDVGHRLPSDRGASEPVRNFFKQQRGDRGVYNV